MAWVCEQIESASFYDMYQGRNVSFQTCVKWVEYHIPTSSSDVANANIDIFSSVAITKSQMVEIGSSLLVIAGLYLAYAIIAKAINSL